MSNNGTKTTVALIFGGRGQEREVSLSGASNIRDLIDTSLFSLIPVYIAPDGKWLMGDEETPPRQLSEMGGEEVFPAYLSGVSGLITKSGIIRLDCAIPLLHGDYGEDGVVQGALANAGIRTVGCDTVSSASARDKYTLKAIARGLGIRTARARLVSEGDTLDDAIYGIESDLPYPVIVKPTRLGSSFGISVAKDREELRAALLSSRSLSKRVIAEEFLSPIRELEIGYFSDKGKDLFTNVGEILYQDGFYDYDKKYRGGAKTKRLATLSEKQKAEITECSSALVRALGLSGMSRLDFFLSGEELYFNEINTIPGLTETSLYLGLLCDSGIDGKEAFRRLILSAISDDRRF